MTKVGETHVAYLGDQVCSEYARRITTVRSQWESITLVLRTPRDNGTLRGSFNCGLPSMNSSDTRAIVDERKLM